MLWFYQQPGNPRVQASCHLCATGWSLPCSLPQFAYILHRDSSAGVGELEAVNMELGLGVGSGP